jgi:hypothetical protein
MAARRRAAAGVVVGALGVGYLGMIVLGSYVFGGAVIDAMRAQQTADLVATLPHQELVMVTVAQERALAAVVEGACAPANPDCPTAVQARTALLEGIPELDQDGVPVVGDDGETSFAQPSAVQQTLTRLDERDQALGALDVEMLDQRVRDAVELTLGDRAAVDQFHDTVEDAPAQAIEAHDRYLRNAAGLSESLVAATDGQLRARIEAQRLVNELILATFQERTAVALSLGASQTGQPGYLEPAAAQVAVVNEQVAAAQDALGRSGSDQQVPPVNGDLAAVRSAVLSGDPGALTPAQAQGFAAASAAWTEELRPVRDAVRVETLEVADDRASAASNRALVTGAVTGVVLILGLAAVIVGSVPLLRRRRTPPAPLAWQQAHDPAVSR